jgi:hypothetical protein
MPGTGKAGYELLHAAPGTAIHEIDPVTEQEGLLQVMCDEQYGLVQVPDHNSSSQRCSSAFGQGVQRPERLVQAAEVAFPAASRAQHCNPLAHAAGQLMRISGFVLTIARSCCSMVRIWTVRIALWLQAARKSPRAAGNCPARFSRAARDPAGACSRHGRDAAVQQWTGIPCSQQARRCWVPGGRR